MSSRKPVSALKKGHTRNTILFLLPWLFSLTLFWYGPILYTIILSFMKYRLIGGGHFTGLANYAKIFQDELFWIGMKNTFAFILMYVPANLVLGLFTAYLLNMEIRYKGLWRSVIYVPAVLPVVAVLVLGKFMFYPNGLINSFIELFGIRGPLWIADPRLIKPASVMLMVWQCGTAMVVYLGALQGVPGQLYEAAEIDGLGRTGQFMNITIPMISPTILFRMVIDMIFGLMIFVPGLILPEGNVQGGPGTASRFYALHIYEKAFQRFSLGEASALATVLIIISMVITFFIMRMSNRYVHYEA